MSTMRRIVNFRIGVIAIVALLALLSTASVGRAAGAADTLDLKEMRSRHYDVVTNVDMETVREVAGHMDQVYRAYMNRIGRAGFKRRIRGRMKLYLLQNHEQYVRVVAERGVNAGGTGGLFMARGNFAALFIFVDGLSKRRLYATLQHEGFHQFAYMMIGDLPVWANEGLAEYFGDAALIEGKLQLGQVGSDRLQRVQGAVRNGAEFAFQKLLNMSSAEWLARVQRNRRSSLLYDQSWSIVHFLVHGGDGRYRKAFMSYLRLIHRGMDSDAAFKKAFGTDNYQAFAARWKGYVRQLNPDPVAEAYLRLTVLGEGLKELARRKVYPTSLGDLRRGLKRIDFKAKAGSHGSERTYSAEDDELFEAPPGHASGVSPELTLRSSRGDDLPPELAVTGLRTPIRLTWQREDDGELSYKVVER